MNEFVQTNAKSNPTKEKTTFVDTCFDWIGAAVIALVVVSILFTTLGRVVNVSGDSMTNTLVNGEKLLLTGVLVEPQYGDIVVIRRENDTPLIKRVIGLPGDKIFINDSLGKVFRNGEELDEPYVRGGHTPSMGMSDAYVVPEDGIFVMGDNRRESLDSRQLRDQIKMNDMVGVITFRLSPFESLRNGD
jgi:signal peptidase I